MIPNTVDNTKEFKKDSEEKKEQAKEEGIENWPHFQSFKTNLKHKSKGELIKFIVDLWIKFEKQNKAYHRLLDYNGFIMLLLENCKQAYPGIDEFFKARKEWDKKVKIQKAS